MIALSVHYYTALPHHCAALVPVDVDVHLFHLSGSPTYEEAKIEKLGSIHLQTPLVHSHYADEPVAGLKIAAEATQVTATEVAQALITARKVFDTSMKASAIISQASLPSDGAGGDVLRTVVSALAVLLKDTLQEELAVFGIDLPEDLPLDFLSLQQFAMHAFIDVVTALAVKYNLPLQNSPALKSLAAGAIDGGMSNEQIFDSVLAAMPPEWQQIVNVLPPDLIKAMLSYPSLASLEYIVRGANQFAPPEVQRYRVHCIVPLSHLLHLHLLQHTSSTAQPSVPNYHCCNTYKSV